MEGFTSNPPRKRNPTLKERKAERKKLKRQARHAAQLAATMAVAGAIVPEASQNLSDFFGPDVVSIAAHPEVAIRYVDEVVHLDRPAPPLLIIGLDGQVLPQPTAPRDRSVDARMRKHHARVAMLEHVLLRELERSRHARQDAQGFAARLTRLAYHPNAEAALLQFALGETYMRSLSDQLAAVTAEDANPANGEEDFPGFEPFSLYQPSEDGMGIAPTPEALDAWEAMRHRLLRGKSELGKRWASLNGSWSPWNVPRFTRHPRTRAA